MRILSVLIWGLAGSAVAAQAAFLEKENLFEAGKDGYALYRIPGIVVTAKGTVLVYGEARKSDRGDWGTIDLMLRRSTDGGKTWAARVPIGRVEGPIAKNPVALAQKLATPGEVTYNNPVAIVERGGAVHFIFCVEYARCFAMRSDDDGLTWSKPVEITGAFEAFRPRYDWKVIATGPAHGIQLRGGRLVVPVWLSTGTGGHAHRPSITSVITSDDGGKTWNGGEVAVADEPPVRWPNETVVAELSDGRVMLNVRSESDAHRRLVVTSPDGAGGWSTPRFDDALLEPICMASLVRVPGDPPRLLFANPHTLERADGKAVPGRPRDRKNLTVKLSEDDGKTWPVQRALEPGWSGYSDLAVAADGTILCFYERGRTDGDMYRTGSLCLARFNVAWLRGEKNARADGVVEADLCVYGGTSGGVVAAVQAARMGKRAVILEPGRHLGGMTAGGLGSVDIGNPRTVGGIARETFTRLAQRTGRVLPWDQAAGEHGGNTKGTGGAFAVEPHVAEELFDELAREAGARVLREARLAAVRKEGARIAEVTLENGLAVRARMWIDASYEGDLLARAGVRTIVGREGNARYGETYNGYRLPPAPLKAFGPIGANGRDRTGRGAWLRTVALDPFVTPGRPESGLVPLVSPHQAGPPGDPAPGVQSYCFRLCMTDDPRNRLPVEPPPRYDPDRYELAARYIAACLAEGDAMDMRWFVKPDPLPNRKWDFNTAWIGANLPGAGWGWAEATYSRRTEIMKEHENHQRGLLRFLTTDARVPRNIREELSRFGLCKDEFKETGGWPHQLYIREARRMVSDLVMTEHHAYGRRVAPDSAGLASYGVDVHEAQRIEHGGLVVDEGKAHGFKALPGPFPVGIGALLPPARECENLLATFAISASHVCFGSTRMEPQLMIFSQSAATAACLAIEDGVPVQRVDAARLRARLLADGQVLEWPPPVRTRDFAGVVVDDEAAEFTGPWVRSAKQPALVGPGYRHDDNTERGKKSARFVPDLPRAGRYEVRFLYPAHANRASNAAVTVLSAEGDRTLRVNQRENALVEGVPRALGVFRFEAGRRGAVVVSNADADGYVVVDAVQFVPEEAARGEGGGGKPGPAPKAALAATPPGEVDGKAYDLVVVGGTPSGIACAVRAAREGLTVLLVEHTRHLGGMMTNGLMQWDALYGGRRAPLFSELLGNIEGHYRAAYGEESRTYQTIRYTHRHYPIGWAEPHVAEREFDRLVAGEKRITVLLGHIPTAAARTEALLRAVTLREFDGARELVVRGACFADATYEGDLAALAKVPVRAGREARDKFMEPHAGKVFTNIDRGPAPLDAVEGRLNIRPYASRQGSIDPSSPFTADGAIQAYNFRLCVTQNPANRILLTEPPPHYRREEYLLYERKSIATNAGPNSKSHMNSPILPGENHGYPEGDWEARRKIARRHLEFALGLMWFLQNDESVPEAKRAEFRKWGLPKDEFVDNGHVPYEMYVREARRLVGRHVYTEHDNTPAPGLARAPIHPDSVAITDWYMDSHSCTTESRPGFKYDGKLILTEESRPGQIPYRCLLPREVDNLLVPVCLSATHVAWGAVRLEPVWMQTGEAAGLAAALAARQKTTPARLDSDLLVRTLCERRALVSFFNDVDVASEEPWVPAVQYLGTRGFFSSYDARPLEALTRPVAEQWAKGVALLREGRLDANAQARALHALDPNGPEVTLSEFAGLLRMEVGRAVTASGCAPEAPLRRADACRLLLAASARTP